MVPETFPAQKFVVVPLGGDSGHYRACQMIEEKGQESVPGIVGPFAGFVEHAVIMDLICRYAVHSVGRVGFKEKEIGSVRHNAETRRIAPLDLVAVVGKIRLYIVPSADVRQCSAVDIVVIKRAPVPRLGKEARVLTFEEN